MKVLAIRAVCLEMKSMQIRCKLASIVPRCGALARRLLEAEGFNMGVVIRTNNSQATLSPRLVLQFQEFLAKGQKLPSYLPVRSRPHFVTKQNAPP